MGLFYEVILKIEFIKVIRKEIKKGKEDHFKIIIESHTGKLFRI